MKKYNYIDLMKTIAMFLVIICHMLLFFSYSPYWYIYADYENETAKFLYNILSCTVISIFVFCSGFLFQASIQRKECKTTVNILNRVKRLLLPYFLYGLLWLVPTYTIFDIPTNGRPKGASLIDGYKAMLLGQFSDVAWFLLMLFWVCVIWILLRKLLKKERLIIGVFVTAVLYLAAHNLLGGIRYYGINQIDIYIIIFFVGASFFWIADKIEKLSLPVLMIISILITTTCMVLEQYMVTYYWLYCIIAIVMPIAMFIFTVGLCKLKLHALVENTWIYKWLLKHNMDIYLLQAPAMYVVFMTLYPLVGKNCFLCILLSYFTTIAVDFILVILLTYLRKAILYLYRKFRNDD